MSGKTDINVKNPNDETAVALNLAKSGVITPKMDVPVSSGAPSVEADVVIKTPKVDADGDVDIKKPKIGLEGDMNVPKKKKKGKSGFGFKFGGSHKPDSKFYNGEKPEANIDVPEPATSGQIEIDTPEVSRETAKVGIDGEVETPNVSADINEDVPNPEIKTDVKRSGSFLGKLVSSCLF